ncbi:hypothetical protein IIU_07038 [Bacillus cereus VD133]|uniref:Uncharacterized protein n=1 Tax=Bacillus cereus VD133 TaxID=1053233 RepID=A0A9W5UYQ5_BACCE|nr:hypothetical protein [Bacillus cereus]EOO23477.1 hypothetical protein IIU_07038 [Bacillus cereus VD133]
MEHLEKANRPPNLDEFIQQSCIVGNDKKIEAQLFYKVCMKAFGLTEISFIGTRTFYKNLKNMGLVLKKSNNNKLYIFGLTLK